GADLETSVRYALYTSISRVSESQTQTRPQARVTTSLRDVGSLRDAAGSERHDERHAELFEHMFDAVPEHVDVYEVGPRDGLQNEKTVLPVETKIAMIESLVDAGIKRIEITSFVNPRWI